MRRAWSVAAPTAEDRRDRERDARRVEQPPLDDADGRELILDRRREQEHVAVEAAGTATSANGRPRRSTRPRVDLARPRRRERDGVVG